MDGTVKNKRAATPVFTKDSLKFTVAEMIALKVQRARWPDGVEIELHPSAFAAPLATAAEPMRIEPEGLCKCGHDMASEHSESGCLRGCALEACIPGEGEEP